MKNFWMVMAVAALMSATVGNVAEASFAFDVRNTGFNSDPVLGSHDDIDNNWTVAAAPGSFTGDAYIKTTGGTISSNQWLANDTTSQWVSAFPGWGAHAAGSYEFETTFDLSSINPNLAYLGGRFLADNQVTDILLNGNSLGVLGPNNQFKVWTGFAIAAGTGFFNNTINTLTFVVGNFGAGLLNPVGLRVEFTEAGEDQGGAVVPEPAAVASWLIGSLCAVGMIGYRRRRSGDLAAAPV